MENEKKTTETEAANEEVKAAEEKTKRKDKKASKKNEADALREENEKLKKELDATKDIYMRTLAEYDNFRKRSQKEKDAAYGDSKANTLKLIIPVIDNFDRAADNKTDDIDVYRKGIEMTVSQLHDILSKLEIETFGEVGDEFDPALHNAVMSVENPDLPENTIASVFEKGYRMGDRILRFATVQVTN